MPANIELSGMEVSLVNAMSRERVLKQYLDTVKCDYDYILLDCMPSLGMLTINALAAADSVIIPVQAQYLPAKGLEQLLQTISKVRRQINPKLKIDGILLSMVDNRTNYAKEIVTAAPRYLRRQAQDIRYGDPPFRPRRRDQRRGQEHLRARPQRESGKSLHRLDKGGVGN